MNFSFAAIIIIVVDISFCFSLGASNPSKFIWEIFSLFEARAKPAVKTTYRAVGSGTGSFEFVGADNGYEAYSDFGSGDIPLAASAYAEATDSGATVLHLPFALGAMSFFHNVLEAEKVSLSPCVLADIFNLDITTWDHPEILALNPDVSVPAGQPIKVYVRDPGSSTTAGVTSYLNAACPEKWDSSKVGATIDWPTGTFEAVGPSGVSRALTGDAYSIGYIDSGHGEDDGLLEISIQNGDGKFLTSTEAISFDGVAGAAAAALQAGLMPSDPTADFSNVSLFNMPGPETWPIVAISYFYVRADQTHKGETGPLLKAFLQYAISEPGQALLADYKFEAVPAAAIAVSQAAIDLIELPANATEWHFEDVDEVQRGAGQLDYVISGKRRAHDEYAINELEDEKADKSAVEALKSQMASFMSSMLIPLHGSGTTNPSKFFWDIMSLFEARAKPGVKMTYRAVGSSTGQLEFIGEDQSYMPYNDFGSGDIPLSSTKFTELMDAGVTVMHLPFSLGAMSFFHNVPNASDLRLTACVLADIFNRQITTWDDAAILDLNPGLSVPAGQPIKVFHRVFGSSTTAGITTYLNAACPSRWPPALVGSTIPWASGTFEAQGSGGMSSAISGEAFTIGYIDSGHGTDGGLPEVSLQNLDGTFQTSAQAIPLGGVKQAAAEALEEGVMPSDPTADFSAVSLHNMPGEFTWPIVAISYIYLRADQTTAGLTGPLLKAFADYVISDDGQALLPEYGFEGVPAEVLAVAQKAIDLLELPSDATEWTFETADETQPGAGQLDYVISGKRRAHDEYAIGELQDEKANKGTLTALAAKLAGDVLALQELVTTLLDTQNKWLACGTIC